ncbi:MAG: hypothetical protein ACLQBY_19090 [Solirubrobacteraceae bacterium]
MSATIEIEAQTLGEAQERHANVDVPGLVMGAVNVRDAPGDLVAPGFRMENRVTAGADEVYCGERAWREWLDDLLAVFAQDARYSAEIIETRDEFVVASYSIRGHGAHSGEWIDFRWVGVTWFHNGQAVRAVNYTSREEALCAVRT